ncbi:hypothetical protein DERP_004422 [Dermatophagoides pteronyssinus]|uniref:Uncharacterized protein n=1 Tax=Dermatophagoides pteronyssinus TaxID=6956 RepID=A0ABQ8JPG3_DERPT|nr:hypothetical protein DERP_004422 [Dermatophagoides pteronyssinus]
MRIYAQKAINDPNVDRGIQSPAVITEPKPDQQSIFRPHQFQGPDEETQSKTLELKDVKLNHETRQIFFIMSI